MQLEWCQNVKIQLIQNIFIWHNKRKGMTLAATRSHPQGGLRGCGRGNKVNFFQNVVVLPIKLNEITNAATW